jgi:hypothetical protein
VTGDRPHVLVLTPVKDVAVHLDRYLALLGSLAWPRDRLSLGLFESDSRDGTYDRLATLQPALTHAFATVGLWKQDFGFHPQVPRWHPSIQLQRRSTIARCRNELLRRALRPEHAWVLWLDGDLQDLPSDLLQHLLDGGSAVVAPHVVSARTGDTFDLNTWRASADVPAIDWQPFLVDGLLQPPRGLGRQYLSEFSDQRVIEVDAVGGCALLVEADLHRSGVLFPEAPVQGLIETEGFALLARARGCSCLGMPQVTVVHS